MDHYLSGETIQEEDILDSIKESLTNERNAKPLIRKTGREAIFLSVFFIKISLIPVSVEQDVRHPVRGSAHYCNPKFCIHMELKCYRNVIVMYRNVRYNYSRR